MLLSYLGVDAYKLRCILFLLGFTGAQRAFLKARKHRSLLVEESPLSAEAHALFKEATSDTLFNAVGVSTQAIGAEKPRLLDVGSCYNPFKYSKHASMFDVTGKEANMGGYVLSHDTTPIHVLTLLR